MELLLQMGFQLLWISLCFPVSYFLLFDPKLIQLCSWKICLELKCLITPRNEAAAYQNWRQFLLTGLVTSTKSGKNAREKAAARVGLASDWLKLWSEFCGSIRKRRALTQIKKFCASVHRWYLFWPKNMLRVPCERFYLLFICRRSSKWKGKEDKRAPLVPYSLHL